MYTSFYIRFIRPTANRGSIDTTEQWTPLALEKIIQNQNQLEIWGRAQREATRRGKSNWGTVKGLKFWSQQSHVAWTQLHYHIHV